MGIVNKKILVVAMNFNITTLTQDENNLSFKEPYHYKYEAVERFKEYKYSKEEIHSLPQKIKHRKKRPFF
tara:strand:+ start:160 stop:369 length:210 start_codon:yes stop_codon:yes gene_type:complete